MDKDKKEVSREDLNTFFSNVSTVIERTLSDLSQNTDIEQLLKLNEEIKISLQGKIQETDKYELSKSIKKIGIPAFEELLTFELRKFSEFYGNWNKSENPPRPNKQIFKWANTILGSVALIIPGAGVLKELKEVVENYLFL